MRIKVKPKESPFSKQIKGIAVFSMFILLFVLVAAFYFVFIDGGILQQVIFDNPEAQAAFDACVAGEDKFEFQCTLEAISQQFSQ